MAMERDVDPRRDLLRKYVVEENYRPARCTSNDRSLAHPLRPAFEHVESRGSAHRDDYAGVTLEKRRCCATTEAFARDRTMRFSSTNTANGQGS